MRVASALVALSILFSSAAIADVKRHQSMPEALQGSWALAADDCGAADKPVVVLSAKTYAGAQAKCSVDWVSETPSPSGPVYSARLRCPGQAAKAPTSANLIIRPEGANKISIGASFGALKAYQKCPAKE
jgi:hypothetical protein